MATSDHQKEQRLHGRRQKHCHIITSSPRHIVTAPMSDMGGDDGSSYKCFPGLTSLPNLVGGISRPQDACISSELLSTPIESFGDLCVTDDRVLSTPEPAIRSKGRVSSHKLREDSLQSITRMLDESGIPKDEFILMHPREIYNPSGANHLESQSFSRQPEKPKPTYPNFVDSDSSASSEKLPVKATSLSHDFIVRPQSTFVPIQSAIPINRKTFVPIEESDNDSSNEKSSRASSTSSSSSIPILKLKPRTRGKEIYRPFESQCDYIS